MNKLDNFDAVVAERKRLEEELARQTAAMRQEIASIQDRLQPVTKTLSFFSNLGKKNNGSFRSLLKLGSDVGIDLIVGNKMRKAGWLARVLLPLAMKFTTRRSIDIIK